MSFSKLLHFKGLKHADMGFHLNQSIFISDIIYGFSSNTQRREGKRNSFHRNCVNCT